MSDGGIRVEYAALDDVLTWKCRSRFEAKYVVEPNSSCWLWTAALDRYGYGVFGVAKYKIWRAHRFAYLLRYGRVPSNLDHLCRIRCCVNPDHLRAITRGENARIGNSPPAINGRKTACKYGHIFDALNTGPAGPGGKRRRCRTCHRLWEKAKRSASNTTP